MVNYTLHAVIVKNNLSLDEAKKIAKDFIKGNKHYYREAKNSYRFRNYPKNYFKPKSYRTKKINQDISLIYGDVKPEYLNKIDNTKYGEGLFDFLKSKFTEIISPRLDYSNNAKNILSEYGNTKINSITVYRTPIQRAITELLNIVSLGKFSKLKKKYNFDDLFHLALIVNTENKNIIIEKNEVVNISFDYETTTQTKTKNVDLLNKNTTILELLDNTRKRIGDNKFFVYDPFSQNCQVFLKDILESNNLYNQDLNNFIFQDISQLVKELPVFAKKGARFLTDVGAFFRKLTGTGLNRESLGKQLLKRLEVIRKKDKEQEFLEDEEYEEKKKEIKEAIKDPVDGEFFLKDLLVGIKNFEEDLEIVFKEPKEKEEVVSEGKLTRAQILQKAREAKLRNLAEKKAKLEQEKKKEQEKTEAFSEASKRAILKKKQELELAKLEQEKKVISEAGEKWLERLRKAEEAVKKAEDNFYNLRNEYENKLKMKDNLIKSKEIEIKDNDKQIEKYDKLIKELRIPKILTSDKKKEAIKAIKDKDYKKFEAIIGGYELIDQAKEIERIKKEETRAYNREYYNKTRKAKLKAKKNL